MTSQDFPVISVRGDIKLGQFLKLANLVEDGATARIAVQSGDVYVNGEVDTRRGHILADGDVITLDAPTGLDGAIVHIEG
ncbi:RNA-binding S4 domain-containing protein [Actinomyces vulturis]|uniref:RNA-binding S4 domain-containing protein n=1 Tax=Actinomyces vulturis TaxID=1857645 RepID=UPI00082A8A04|nr:RNA-binding S4 domain-containing protein [Actinomyces vulturis]